MSMPKRLKKILSRHFGREQGEKIWQKAGDNYGTLCILAEGESESRKKNLIDGIYPFAAIYEVLLGSGMEKDKAMEHMFAIMKMQTMAGNRRFYQVLGKFPFFFSVFRKMFRTGLKGDSWTVDWIADDQEKFIYNIRTCLWHDTCTDLGYPELCRIFCRNDELNFTDVSKHLYFERTEALGYGGKCCDFHFYAHSPRDRKV